MNETDVVRAVDATITGRRSVRAFLPDPVPHDVIAGILDVAARAPAGGHTPPREVHVLPRAARPIPNGDGR